MTNFHIIHIVTNFNIDHKPEDHLKFLNHASEMIQNVISLTEILCVGVSRRVVSVATDVGEQYSICQATGRQAHSCISGCHLYRSGSHTYRSGGHQAFGAS